MLLNEGQKQQRALESQDAQLKIQGARLQAWEKQLAGQAADLAALRVRLTILEAAQSQPHQVADLTPARR